jgi:hypothetical protein
MARNAYIFRLFAHDYERVGTIELRIRDVGVAGSNPVTPTIEIVVHSEDRGDVVPQPSCFLSKFVCRQQ